MGPTVRSRPRRGTAVAMSGFDDPGIYYSDSFGGDASVDEGQVRKSQLQKRFKEFLRQYRVGTDRTGFTFKYRCCCDPSSPSVALPTPLCTSDLLLTSLLLCTPQVYNGIRQLFSSHRP